MRIQHSCIFGFFLTITLIITACSSRDPDLYTLGMEPGTAHTGVSEVVLIRPIGLARYLERPGIVQSSTNYRVLISANDWWGEPLGPMILRVLVDDLSERLPGSTILPETGAVSINSRAYVEVNVQRFDMDQTGKVVLQANFAVTSVTPGSTTRAGSILIEVARPTPDTRGQVAAMSGAIGRLADRIAVTIGEP